MDSAKTGSVPKVRAGVYLALATAVISGVSIYLNKFAITGLKDPVLLSGFKNGLVAVALVGVLVAAGRLGEIRRLTRRQSAALLAIGAFGGGVPFILFFRGLAMTEAVSAAFIHKTLFIWVALLAAPLLGERLGRWQIAGVGVLLAGNLALLLPRAWSPSTGDLLVFTATLLWAAEAIVARRLLRGSVSARLAAASRMTVGSAVIWVYLGVTGAGAGAALMSGSGAMWLIVTAALLTAYVLTWYKALKLAPAAVVTSVLVVGSPITKFLSTATGQGGASTQAIAASVVLVLGTAFLIASTLRGRAPKAEAASA